MSSLKHMSMHLFEESAASCAGKEITIHWDLINVLQIVSANRSSWFFLVFFASSSNPDRG